MSTYAGRAVLPALISDNRGNALPGINVTVYNRGTTVKPTLYTDRTKATTLSNPFLTDAYGNVFPYAEPGEYDMLVNGVTIPFSVVNDPAEPVDSEIGDLSITDAKIAVDAAIAQSKIAGLVADLAGKEPSIPPGTFVQPAEPLTTGSALFADAAGAAAQDNDNFLWDEANRRLILRPVGDDQTGRDDGAIGAPLHFQHAWAPLDRNARWPFTMAGPTGSARALIGLTNEPGNTQPDTLINVRTFGPSGRLRLTKDSDATSWWFSINRDRIVEAPADALPGLRVLGKGLTLTDAPAAALLVTGDELILAQQGAAHTSVVLVAGNDATVHRPVLRGTRSRGTLAAPTAVAAGDRILDIAASGYDGIDAKTTAMITFDVADTVVAGSVPARINFITSASTPGARVERVSIPHNLDGFTFGALRDVSLYRSGVGTIRTDVDFNINGLTTIDQEGFIGLTEITAPAVPGSNRSRLYCRDNGAGKTQVVVVFPTGAVQVLATEP